MSQLRSSTEVLVPPWITSLREHLAQHGEPAVVAEIDQSVDQFRSAQLTIALLGKVKRGKSTLLNALLGRRDDVVAPIDRLPASCAITQFRWSEQEAVQVIYRDGHQEAISFSRIREFVTEESNRDNHKQVDVVHVSGPFTGINRATVLVDTPGAGSIHEHHDALLHAFIPQADVVLFLVTSRMPLDQDELELLARIKTADIPKVFFVINRIDEAEEQDLQDAIQHNQALLARHGIAPGVIHRISAKQSFQGNAADSGVPELLAAVGTFLAAQRGPTLQSRLVTRVRQAVEVLIPRWELDFQSATKSAGELNAELRRLETRQATLAQEREFASREFLLAWKRAADEFDFALQGSRAPLQSGLRTRIECRESPGAGSLSQGLPALLNELVAERLTPLTSEFETKLRQATDRLQATYPQFHMSVEGHALIAPRTNATALMATSAGGIAIASTGMGLAAAGSAVASSIAAANAAALAATTTVAVPTALGGLLGSVPYLGSVLTQLATGTAALSTPAALTATPLWVALSGPIGWTMAGIGVLAIPIAWRSSQLKAKQQIEAACLQQLDQILDQLRTERLPAIREMASSIVDEFQQNLDRQLGAIQRTLQQHRDRPSKPDEIVGLQSRLERLRQLWNSAT